MRRQPVALLWSFAFILVLLASFPSVAATEGNPFCATYPGRILTELAKHRQYVNQRVRPGFQTQLVSPSSAVDVGNIAVLPDDGTMVTPANIFDLDQRRLTFTPSGSGYSVRADAGVFDSAAASQGTLLNPLPPGNPDSIGDDGALRVQIGFSFPFYGANYSEIWINSDGNLTFGTGDATASQRSVSRVITGPPRIAPFYTDLDPSTSGQLTYFADGSRFVVSWNQVRDYSSFGFGPSETFQVVLTPDGRIQIVYAGIAGHEAVAGIAPGNGSQVPSMVDLSTMNGTGIFLDAILEVFTATTQLDIVAVAQRFYQTHEDAYQFLVAFTNFDFDMGGAFAFEVNVSNYVTGIGPLFDPPVFDFSREFGSSRLESMLTMGNLAQYPASPATVFFRGVDSTLSIMGQESGHRFLAYVDWADPQGSAHSTDLLGRDFQHWSFLLNSDASDVEGNRIRDNGNGTFTTVGAVEHYSDLDQYLMGLRGPEEVSPTFVVKNPTPAQNPARAPTLNVSFAGSRRNVIIDQIIAANGPRLPSAAVAPRRFNFAFALVVPRGSFPTQDQLDKIERIRSSWESYFGQAVGGRATASTSLVRSMRLAPQQLGILSGTQQTFQINLQSAPSADLTVSLTTANPGVATVPAVVTIPTGARAVNFPVAAANVGRARIEASTAGYEIASAVVEVVSAQVGNGATLSIISGNNQSGAPDATLPVPLTVVVQDPNRTVYTGIPVQFTVVSGNATVITPATETNSSGRASTMVRLGTTVGPVVIRAAVPGTLLSADFSLLALGMPRIFTSGIVNGASFSLGASGAAPGGIISIFGENLAPTTASAVSLPLPTVLGSTVVQIGGVPAPLFYVSPGQINAQVPFEFALFPLPADTLVRVINNGSASDAVSLTVKATAPGIFTRDWSGQGLGAITHAATQADVTGASPARPGEFVQIFATGLGAVSPPVETGRPATSDSLSNATASVTASIGGRPAPVSFAGLAPGFVGVYQVNVQVPEIVPGNAQLMLSVGAATSSPVMIPIGPP